MLFTSYAACSELTTQLSELGDRLYATKRSIHPLVCAIIAAVGWQFVCSPTHVVGSFQNRKKGFLVRLPLTSQHCGRRASTSGSRVVTMLRSVYAHPQCCWMLLMLCALLSALPLSSSLLVVRNDHMEAVFEGASPFMSVYPINSYNRTLYNRWVKMVCVVGYGSVTPFLLCPTRTRTTMSLSHDTPQHSLSSSLTMPHITAQFELLYTHTSQHAYR